VVAFPTETSYGLAVDPLHPAALARLFALKGREEGKPVLVIVDDLAQLAGLTAWIPPVYRPLMARFWPGPLTLVFPAASAGLPALLTGGTGTVGARVSSHPVAARLVRAVGRPITATSANLSGLLPAASALEVIAQLGHGVDLVLDGGCTPGGPGSTVAGLRDGVLCLLRAGVIPFVEILSHSVGLEGE